MLGEDYQLGQDIAFTAEGDADTVKYLWGVNTDTPTIEVTTTAGALKTITVPGSSITKFGPNWVSVASVDQFGQPSDVERQVFDVAGFGETGRWRLDGNGQDVDCASGDCVNRAGGHPLAFTGSHQWVEGKWAFLIVDGPFGPEIDELDPTDQAVDLDGSSGFGSTVAPVVTTVENLSVAAWVRMEPAASDPVAVSQVGDQAAAFYLGYAEGTWAFTMKSQDGSGGTVRAASAPVTPDPDEWVHLIGVYDHGNHKIYLYVDGELAGDADFTATWNASGPLMVGRSQSQATPANFWPGVIDEVRVFPGALTGQQVRDVYAEARTNPPPEIEATGPAADEADVPLDTVITATFTEPVDPFTISIEVAGTAGAPVSGSWDYDFETDTVTFTPEDRLDSLTEYSVSISGAVDFDGEPMEPVTWWFTTEEGDITPPTVSTLVPAPDSVDIPLDAVISAIVSEPVDEVTIDVQLVDTVGAAIGGATDYDPGTGALTFTPSANLTPWVTYSVIVSGAVDAAGNAMTAESWSFTAEPGTPASIEIDSSTPARVSTSGLSGVVTTAPFDPPAGSLLLATVSADTDTYTGATITMSTSGGPLAWSTVVDQDWPNSEVPGGHASVHVASVSTGLSGLTVTATSDAELPLSLKVYVLTGANLDAPVGAIGQGSSETNNYSPTAYVSTTPGSRGFGVASDFMMRGQPVSTDDEDAFDIDDWLSGLSVAKATTTESVGTEVEMNFDAPGSSFTEWNWAAVEIRPAGVPDALAPQVTSFTPIGDATNIAPETVLTAQFNEHVDISSIVVDLQGPGGMIVAGAASYDTSSRNVTFVPEVNLAALTTYAVTISGAADATGNPMIPEGWSFTTGPIGIDKSSPARVSSSGSSEVVTTAGFDPPAGSVLLAMVSADTDDDQSATISMSNSGDPLGWWTAVDQDWPNSEVPGEHASVHVGSLPSSLSGLTVTATSDVELPLSLKVYVVTGASLDAPVGALGQGSSTANNSSPTAYISTTPGSRGFGVASDFMARGLPVSSDEEDAFDEDWLSGLSVVKAMATDSPGTDVEMNFDGGGGSFTEWNWAAVEIRPAGAPDTTVPWIVAHSPDPDTLGVSPDASVSAMFSETVDEATIDIELVDSAQSPVSGAAIYTPETRTITFNPAVELEPMATYTVTVSGVEDPSGIEMALESWSFTTMSDSIPFAVGTSAGGIDEPGQFTVALPGGSSGYMAIASGYDAEVTAPPGWTEVHSDGWRSENQMTVYIASDVDNPGVTWTVDAGVVTASVLIIGYDRPISVDGDEYAGTLTSPSVTTTEPVLIARIYTDNAWDDPMPTPDYPDGTGGGAFHYVHSGDPDSGGSLAAYAHTLQFAPGATGAAEWSLVTGRRWAEMTGTVALVAAE